VTSGFRREVYENGDLLGYYAAIGGNVTQLAAKTAQQSAVLNHELIKGLSLCSPQVTLFNWSTSTYHTYIQKWILGNNNFTQQSHGEYEKF